MGNSIKMNELVVPLYQETPKSLMHRFMFFFLCVYVYIYIYFMKYIIHIIPNDILAYCILMQMVPPHCAGVWISGPWNEGPGRIFVWGWCWWSTPEQHQAWLVSQDGWYGLWSPSTLENKTHLHWQILVSQLMYVFLLEHNGIKKLVTTNSIWIDNIGVLVSLTNPNRGTNLLDRCAPLGIWRWWLGSSIQVSRHYVS